MSDEEYYIYSRTYPRLPVNPDYGLGKNTDFGWCDTFRGFVNYKTIIENGKKKA